MSRKTSSPLVFLLLPLVENDKCARGSRMPVFGNANERGIHMITCFELFFMLTRLLSLHMSCWYRNKRERSRSSTMSNWICSVFSSFSSINNGRLVSSIDSHRRNRTEGSRSLSSTLPVSKREKSTFFLSLNATSHSCASHVTGWRAFEKSYMICIFYYLFLPLPLSLPSPSFFSSRVCRRRVRKWRRFYMHTPVLLLCVSLMLKPPLLPDVVFFSLLPFFFLNQRKTTRATFVGQYAVFYPLFFSMFLSAFTNQ